MKNSQNGHILNPEFTSIPVAKAHPPKRRDIQGLRAWAIILVLLFHYFPEYFPNGYVGVDMFFVISGYLIGMIVCKFEVLDRQALQTFYYRRAKRIFPLYYLAIGLIFVMMYVCLSEPSYDINTNSGMKAIFLLTNMKSELDPEQDYAKLLADAEDLFTHTWSLCVEIKWYFLVPFIFMAQRRLPISAMHFFIGIGSISLFYHLISNDTIAFNSTFARVWQFCSGITAYVATVYEKKNLRPEVNNNNDKETRLLLNDQDESENQDVQLVAEDRRLLPYIAYFLFALIMVTFSWSTEEPHHLRIEMTFLTTILIAIGEYYEIWILSNALMNYIGNISYSLYLVHWPIFTAIKYFAPDSNLALLIGIGLSLLTASIIYFVYEQPYLKLGAVKIFILIGVLFVASLILTQPSIVTNRIDYERKFGVYDLDLEKGDPSKNLSIAVALNYYEGIARVGASNAVENCTHIDFGSKEVKAPYGLCKMPGKHTGKLKFLVMGNSYACNQGHIVYEAFQNLTKEFHFFCLVACEPLIEQKVNGCPLFTQWHDIYNQIKPDVLFMLHRPIMGMAQLDETKPIEQDYVYQQHVRMLSWYLKQDELLKIYIQHALPRCPTYCVGYINKWILKENKPLRFAGDRFTIHNEKWERIRFEHLVKMKTCEGRCELFDYYPEMLNKKGEFSVYDENTNLAYFDNTQHFSKFGRDKVKIVYQRLAEKFAKQYPQLDSVSKKSPICCMSGRMMSLVNPSQPAYGGDSPQALSLNGKTKDEPLGRFRVAKRELGQIFNDLKETVQELESVYNAADEKIIQKEHKDGVEALQESIKTILDTFRRDNMKCVFFGRTSNGKSTTVNAMLHEKILPQGMGHTTCCFLQVQGCDEEQGYLQLDDNPKRIDLDMLGKMGHALSSENSDLPAMGQDSLLRVFYPKGKGATTNRLLQNDVVILDSPGVDLSPEFDAWIDKHCLDADVFVLVCNAEATLTQAEKNFFLRVAKKLSKPNVFILNNRWDASAAEMDNVENVKKQHMTRFQQFLVNELEVCTEREVAKRIFFVSSREILDSRLKERGLVNKAYQMDGYQERALEFQDFERHFEQCISRSAIHTKFQEHNRRALEILDKMKQNIESVNGLAQDEKRQLEHILEESTRIFNECRMNFAQFEKAYREQTERLRAEVHLKVSADFNEAIGRLEAIIDRFNKPFEDSRAGIEAYKQELALFVDECVSNDLEARCTGGLMSRIWNLENDMFRYVTKILAEPYQHKLEEVWRYRAPFKFSICVDAPSLTKDFHEDLEFRFTFGLHAIIRRIIAYRSGQPITAIQTNLLTPVALRNVSNSNAQLHDEAMAMAAEENAMMTQMALSSAAYLANGSLGLLVIGGIVYKAVGWRVIALGVVGYGGLYAWERLRWNSSAKEQHLKEQFRSHLTARMKHVAAAHTSHCETQAMREMDQVFDGLRSTVGGVHREMKEDLDKQKKQIDIVEGTIKSLQNVKGKAALFLGNLEKFATSFLYNDSPTS